MRRSVIPVLLVAALAGCLTTGPTDGDGPPIPDAPRVEPPWPFILDATCDDASLFFYVDLAHVQSLLPPGFTAADAADWVTEGGPEVPSGRGVISVSVLDCPSTSLGDGAHGEAGVMILVEAPAVEGAVVDQEPLATVYMLGMYVTSAAYQERLAPWGHDIVRASVEGHVSDPPQSGAMSITIRDGAGVVARFTAAVPGYEPLEAAYVNVWQATDQGLLYGRNDLVAREFGSGAPVTCSVREGSSLHAWLGFTDCAGQVGQASAAKDDPYKLSWTHFPGASAGP